MTKPSAVWFIHQFGAMQVKGTRTHSHILTFKRQFRTFAWFSRWYLGVQENVWSNILRGQIASLPMLHRPIKLKNIYDVPFIDFVHITSNNHIIGIIWHTLLIKNRQLEHVGINNTFLLLKNWRLLIFNFVLICFYPVFACTVCISLRTKFPKKSASFLKFSGKDMGWSLILC